MGSSATPPLGTDGLAPDPQPENLTPQAAHWRKGKRPSGHRGRGQRSTLDADSERVLFRRAAAFVGMTLQAWVKHTLRYQAVLALSAAWRKPLRLNPGAPIWAMTEGGIWRIVEIAKGNEEVFVEDVLTGIPVMIDHGGEALSVVWVSRGRHFVVGFEGVRWDGPNHPIPESVRTWFRNLTNPGGAHVYRKQGTVGDRDRAGDAGDRGGVRPHAAVGVQEPAPTVLPVAAAEVRDLQAAADTDAACDAWDRAEAALNDPPD